MVHKYIKLLMFLFVGFGDLTISKSSKIPSKPESKITNSIQKTKPKTRTKKRSNQSVPQPRISLTQILKRISQLETLLVNSTQQAISNPCKYNKCKNRSACIISDNRRSRRCECSPGNIGVSCEIKLPVGAYCKKIVTKDELFDFGFSDGYFIDWNCNCPNSHTGKYCEIKTEKLTIESPCETNPCKDQNETCWVDFKDNTKFQCLASCPPGFEGEKCENCVDGLVKDAQGLCTLHPMG